MIVLDTNIVLDAFVFKDPGTLPLLVLLDAQSIQWIATPPMRDELERVLAYPKIVARMAFSQVNAVAVLAQFDSRTKIMAVAPKASVTCTDPDDQKFIDLAVAHKTTLLSKDKAVICMTKRLLALSVQSRIAI